MVRVRFSVLEVCTFLLASLVVLAIGQRQVNQSCVLPNGRAGRCIRLEDCTEVVELMKRKVLYPREMEQIKAWIGACEGDKNSVNQIVCCEKREPIVPTTTVRTETAFKPDHFRNVLPVRCGTIPTPRLTDHISSDAEDVHNNYVWAVYLEIHTPNSKETGRCVGTLIQESFVLTAAHCLHKKSKENIKLFFALYKISKLAECLANGECQERKATKFFIHPDYSFHTKWNDIALVRLNKPVDTSGNIVPACLPLNYTFDESLSNDQRVLSLGWGANEQETKSDSKGVAYLKVISQDDCGDFLKKSSRLNATTMFSVMCTVGMFPGQDVCQGDSGAPMLQFREKQFFVVGVVNFGPKCGLENVPGVSVRVSEYIDWILTNLK